MGLRPTEVDENRFQLVCVEGVNSLNPIRLHGRHDLQIEYVSAGDGAAL